MPGKLINAMLGVSPASGRDIASNRADHICEQDMMKSDRFR